MLLEQDIRLHLFSDGRETPLDSLTTELHVTRRDRPQMDSRLNDTRFLSSCWASKLSADRETVMMETFALELLFEAIHVVSFEFVGFAIFALLCGERPYIHLQYIKLNQSLRFLRRCELAMHILSHQELEEKCLAYHRDCLLARDFVYEHRCLRYEGYNRFQSRNKPSMPQLLFI